MDKKDFKEAIGKARSISTKRKFKQSVDLVINLKDINLKNPAHQLDLFVPLPHPKGKETKICAIVGPELSTQAKEACNTVITDADFEKYARDKKLTKKLATEHHFFIAQANLMAEIAKNFGRILGPKGKMPNPKAGCVVPPNANLKQLTERLQKTIRVTAKVQLSVKCLVGNEAMNDAEILDNIMAVYNNVIHHLPSEENNVRSVFIKLTMGRIVKVGAKEEEEAGEKPAEEKKEAPKEEKKEKVPKAEEKPKEKKPAKKKAAKKEEAKE